LTCSQGGGCGIPGGHGSVAAGRVRLPQSAASTRRARSSASAQYTSRDRVTVLVSVKQRTPWPPQGRHGPATTRASTWRTSGFATCTRGAVNDRAGVAAQVTFSTTLAASATILAPSSMTNGAGSASMDNKALSTACTAPLLLPGEDVAFLCGSALAKLPSPLSVAMLASLEPPSSPEVPTTA